MLRLRHGVFVFIVDKQVLEQLDQVRVVFGLLRYHQKGPREVLGNCLQVSGAAIDPCLWNHFYGIFNQLFVALEAHALLNGLEGATSRLSEPLYDNLWFFNDPVSGIGEDVKDQVTKHSQFNRIGLFAQIGLVLVETIEDLYFVTFVDLTMFK